MPFFFENEQGEAVTVNGDRYRAMLKEFLFPNIEEATFGLTGPQHYVLRRHFSYQAMLNEFLFTKIKEKDMGNIWFQQDGATCHIAEATHDVLSPVFEYRIIISSKADVVWPPRS